MGESENATKNDCKTRMQSKIVARIKNNAKIRLGFQCKRCCEDNIACIKAISVY